MRVLCTCVPGFGHFHPMVPLARALRQAGHEVAFSTAERFCRRVVEPAGFATFPAGLSPHVAFDRTIEIAGAPGGGGPDLWRFGARMFAGVAAPAKVEALVAAAGGWPADLLVHDVTDYAGPVAAAATGIPWAGHGLGPLHPDEFWDVAAGAAAPMWAAAGLAARPLAGMFDWLFVDVCPAPLQSAMLGRVQVARPMRPVPFDDDPSGRPLPPWVADLGRGPTVYVTLGTVANHTPGVFEIVLEALAGQPGDVVATVGPDRDPLELGPRPTNVHVERYLPQSRLFPMCDLVVCHGGSGTVLAALGAGLPMLVLPQDANQFWNADRIADLGAGEQLRPGQVTPAAVQEAVTQLLGDPRYRARARSMAVQIAAMPAPDELVPPLEELSSTGRADARGEARSRRPGRGAGGG